jgi:hypothetical protein
VQGARELCQTLHFHQPEEGEAQDCRSDQTPDAETTTTLAQSWRRWWNLCRSYYNHYCSHSICDYSHWSGCISSATEHSVTVETISAYRRDPSAANAEHIIATTAIELGANSAATIHDEHYGSAAATDAGSPSADRIRSAHASTSVARATTIAASLEFDLRSWYSRSGHWIAPLCEPNGSWRSADSSANGCWWSRWSSNSPYPAAADDDDAAAKLDANVTADATSADSAARTGWYDAIVVATRAISTDAALANHGITAELVKSAVASTIGYPAAALIVPETAGCELELIRYARPETSEGQYGLRQ